jgi:hypothetical protein
MAMNYDLAKHAELRLAVVNAIEAAALTEIPGGVHNARVKPFDSVDVENDYPVVTVFTGNDSAEYSDDELNLKRDYDISVVIVSKGYDVADLQSGQDSFIQLADAAQKALENVLTKFRYTLGALIYRLKYLRADSVIDEDGEYYTNVKILYYNAHSIEKVINA